MNMRKILFCFALVLGAEVGASAKMAIAADQSSPTLETKATSPDPHFLVPPRSYAVVGHETRIDGSNLLLSDAHNFRRIVIGESGHALVSSAVTPKIVGKMAANRWSLVPTVEQVGRQELEVQAIGKSGLAVDQASMELCVAPADAGVGREIALLIVGDSLTHATHYPNEWARLLSQPGNPKWTMLGTHKPTNAAEGVAHEGYGGWRWQTFLERYEPKPDPVKRIRSSPFVFAGADGKPGLDLPRYFREACGGRKPDYVTFLLGINDCFAAPADDRAALDKHIDGVFANADKLLAAFHKTAPNAKLAVCLTPPPNSRAEAFTANYKGKYPRDGWLKIQRRLVERQMQHFGNREAEHIYVVPTNLDLDTVADYPPDNAVHPNKDGYARIAASLHAWLKWQLYEESLSEKRK
jgi:lysophospholipase L1-like esterase